MEEPQEENEELNIQGEMSSLADQMKTLAEEARKKRLQKGMLGKSGLSTAKKAWFTLFLNVHLDANITERRGILKPQQTSDSPSSSLPRRSQSFATPRSLLKSSPSNDKSAFREVKPSRVDVSNDKDDEGISCNDSGSDSEPGAVKSKPKLGRTKMEADDTTSEGESSGGREVKSIFKNESRLNLNFK